MSSVITQHPGRAGECLHQERTLRIGRHLEHRFAFQAHGAVFAAEARRVAHRAPRGQPHAGSVHQVKRRLAVGRHEGHFRGPRQVVFRWLGRWDIP